jgi:hypothetical protein
VTFDLLPLLGFDRPERHRLVIWAMLKTGRRFQYNEGLPQIGPALTVGSAYLVIVTYLTLIIITEISRIILTQTSECFVSVATESRDFIVLMALQMTMDYS